MILSDRELKRELDQGDLVVEPIEDEKQQIQPASIDLRLGKHFTEPRAEKTTIDLGSEDHRLVGEDDEEYAGITIRPGDFYLGTTMERVEIPPNMMANIKGRSSIGRVGVIVHATAGVIDPGFKGQITLELSNLGNDKVHVPVGKRVAQLVVESISSTAERPYGEDRGSKYQEQNGPQQSRIWSENQ